MTCKAGQNVRPSVRCQHVQNPKAARLLDQDRLNLALSRF